MTTDTMHTQGWKPPQQQLGQGDERSVLSVGEGLIISALKFDAYRKIITVFPVFEQ
jgi:hypothetical protein